MPRRFTTERDTNNTYLTFGASSEAYVENDQVLQDPTNFVMEINGKNYITDESFDPKKLITSDKFGIAPSNTILTILYRVNTTENVNAAASSVNTVGTLITEFENQQVLNTNDVNDVNIFNFFIKIYIKIILRLKNKIF